MRLLDEITSGNCCLKLTRPPIRRTDYPVLPLPGARANNRSYVRVASDVEAKLIHNTLSLIGSSGGAFARIAPVVVGAAQ